jgi:hypothetical protein
MTDIELLELALRTLLRDLAELASYDRPDITARVGAPATQVVHREISDAVAVLQLNPADLYPAFNGADFHSPRAEAVTR